LSLCKYMKEVDKEITITGKSKMVDRVGNQKS
jgi:hypothetical protein